MWREKMIILENVQGVGRKVPFSHGFVFVHLFGKYKGKAPQPVTYFASLEDSMSKRSQSSKSRQTNVRRDIRNMLGSSIDLSESTIMGSLRIFLANLSNLLNSNSTLSIPQVFQTPLKT